MGASGIIESKHMLPKFENFLMFESLTCLCSTFDAQCLCFCVSYCLLLSILDALASGFDYKSLISSARSRAFDHARWALDCLIFDDKQSVFCAWHSALGFHRLTFSSRILGLSLAIFWLNVRDSTCVLHTCHILVKPSYPNIIIHYTLRQFMFFVNAIWRLILIV